MRRTLRLQLIARLLAACALAAVVAGSGPLEPPAAAAPARSRPPPQGIAGRDAPVTPGAVRRQISIAGGGFTPTEDRAAYSTLSAPCRYERAGSAVPLALQAAVQLPSQATLVWLDLGGVDSDAAGDQT